MKKLLTLSAAGLLAMAAHAQQSQQVVSSNVLTPLHDNGIPMAHSPASAAVPGWVGAAKTGVATVFVTDTFTATSLTTGGWIAGGNTGSSSWKYANTGSNYIGTLASTTGKSGFMFYDANAVAAANANVPIQIGTLTSPAYNCATRNYVGVRFQQLYRRLADTCYVDVSNNNFTSYTRYSVNPNNTLGGNAQTDNPLTTTINITSAAANQTSVKIRFVYIGAFAGTGQFNGSGGTYGWQVDDFQLLELDQVDLSVGRSVMAMPLHNANGHTTFGSIPRSFVDTLFAMTNLYNYGGTAQTNANVKANTYFAGTSVKSVSQNKGLVPINDADDSVYFWKVPANGYKPTASGSLVTVMSVNQASDGTPANDVDSVFQVISDSVWYDFRPNSPITGGFYVQRGANATTTPPTTAVGFYTGSLYEVGAGKIDTLTSVDIAFHPITVAGGQMRAVIYKRDDTDPMNPSWNQFGSTVTRTIAAADIPASGSIIWTKFMSNIGTGSVKQYSIMNEGDYAVVVQSINLPAANTTVVYNAKGPAYIPGVGRLGLSDTAGASFGTRVTDNETVPLIRLNFSNNAKGILNPTTNPGSVANTQGSAYELNAFPNPANNDLKVSFKLPVAQDATVRLMNTMGQVVMTQELGKLAAGQAASASFNIARLAGGMYYYSVESAGTRATGRVVIAH